MPNFPIFDMPDLPIFIEGMEKMLMKEMIGIKQEAQDPQEISLGHKLWSSEDGATYFSVADTFTELPPDVYEPRLLSNGNPFFYRVNFSTEELLRFEDSSIDSVVREITEFWKRRSKFEEFGFPYRRGILLHGPPGSGKSSAVKLIISDVIKQGGIGLRFDNPHVFIQCMRNFRLVQPKTPVVGIMEDLDGIMMRFDESMILNMLDGIDSFENIVYLATTNYPENLENRIKNRPSRFDRRFEIGYPEARSRHKYISHLVSKVSSASSLVDIDRWVEDTNELTLAHIKELFISVVLFETEYDNALKTLQEMRKSISSNSYEDSRRTGFIVNRSLRQD